MKRTTIEDVARKAGVGKVTVSYVLNGRSATARISPKTQEKVLQAVRDLDYRPNGVARMLAKSRSQILAVVFQHGEYFSTWSSFTSEAMRGVCAAAVAEGYDLMLHTKVASAGNHEADALADGRVDGALILRDQNDPTLTQLVKRGFPCVQFFTRSDEECVPFVDSDNYSGGRLATRHLLELGHRKIGMVLGPPLSTSSRDRFNGYREALEEFGLSPEPIQACQIVTPTSPMCPAAQLLEQKDRPTALFVWSDDVAFEIMKVAREFGLSIPEDLSIVGYDSLEDCNRCSPALTSVRQPIVDMAFNAAQLLVSLIEKRPIERRQMLFPPSLDIRGSTAPPRP